MAGLLGTLGPRASTACGFALGCSGAGTVLVTLGLHGTDAHSAGQLSLAILGVLVVGAWVGAELGLVSEAAAATSSGGGVYELVARSGDEVEGGEAAAEEAGAAAAVGGARPAASGRWVAGRAGADALRRGSEFALWIAVMYACDRTDLVPRGPKRDDPASFWCLWLGICGAAACTVRQCRSPRVLAREQTEEWKGWMQLMFLLYHYFAQAPLYNAIRVYIAGYVWMTGYGNFLYYAKTGNFGAVRICQTLFRLNFFVVVTCLALRNEYMLYYIAPMHTVFTLFVWLALRVCKHVNASPSALVAKVVATLAATAVLYDAPGVFAVAFGWPPLRQLVAFHDPLHPEFEDELHEWHFRSGLDRYIWVFGMACAAGLPLLETVLSRVAAAPGLKTKLSAYAALVAALVAAMAAWGQAVFLKDKYAYNALHPYTSWIPVLCYIVARNLTPGLRARYLLLFTFLGQVTLETYILQFHVWMKTTGVNGSPKFLLVLFPDHFWLNFAVVSALYFLVSVRIFKLTVGLRNALIPEDAARLPRALAIAAAAAGLVFAAGHALRKAFPEP